MKKKGDYGYRDFYKIKNGCWILFFVLAIIAQYTASRLAGRAEYRNILLVMSVLTVLPMANLLSPYLAAFRYKTPPKERFREVEKFSSKGKMLYDFVLTSKEQIIPIDFALIHSSHALLYTPLSGMDKRKAIEFLEGNFKANGCKIKMVIYDDWGKYIRDLDKLSEYSERISDKAADLFRSLSI